ncbi:MAG: cysteine--tRNA ligase [Patescibacteria group bacterium]|nr:cysteine--tRNA ligase [Patescibacteria group bacterium]
MQIHNTVTKSKENFEPLEEGKVKVYVCGPTVYDVGHLGHGRSAVAFDVVRKYLQYKGYDVIFASNYTDIDDKMINRAKEEGIAVEELANKIIPEYERDYAALGIAKPDIQPKATEYMEAIVELIKRLNEKGYTYSLDDGVYFDVSRYENYGKFSGQNLEDLQVGARVEVDENKRNPYDFALWKFKKEGEPAWPSPWGEGRPGWHIECSAMAWKVLGEKFDIHGGGLDLKFPHHECEVAQTKGVFGDDSFAKYWIHNGFIQIDNEKMSKSLGNFFTLKEIFGKYDPQVVRLMFLQTHYRNPINFSDVLLEQAKAALSRLHDFVRNLKNHTSNSNDEFEYNDEMLKIPFEKFMDNDFDTSGGFGVVFEFVKAVNTALDSGSKVDVDVILKALKEVDSVLGVIFPLKEESIPENVKKLADERIAARKNKDFEKSDDLRDKISEAGYTVEDSADGYVLKPKL